MSRGRRACRRIRIRRCLVSGRRDHQDTLLRFVVERGQIQPDLQLSKGGRGYWVKSSRHSLQTAIDRNLFARAARCEVAVSGELPAIVERGLVRRLLMTLSGLQHLAVDDGVDDPATGREGFVFAPAGTDGGPDLPLTVYRCLDGAEIARVSKGMRTCGFMVPCGGIARRIRVEAERLGRFRASDDQN